MRLGELLDVVNPGRERVMVVLGGADPEHVQNDLRVLGVVLVPAVVKRLAGARERQRGDQAHLEAGLDEPPGDRAMIVAGRLEAAGHGLPQAEQELDEAVVLSAGVEQGEPSPAALAWDLEEDLVAGLGDIERYENAGMGRKLVGGHGRSVSSVRLATL